MKTPEVLSPLALSNLFTMGVAARLDPRQAVPPVAGMPDAATRILRARLCMEETLETIAALGVEVMMDCGAVQRRRLDMDRLRFTAQAPYDASLEEAIDGACDLMYVACGTLCALGVPDLPHLAEVCRANNAKFPGGVGTADAHGKYQKPAGWTPPRHVGLAYPMTDLAVVTASLLSPAAPAEDGEGCRGV